jgi:hypothetical protein
MNHIPYKNQESNLPFTVADVLTCNANGMAGILTGIALQTTAACGLGSALWEASKK